MLPRLAYLIATYIREGATYEINISPQVRREVMSLLDKRSHSQREWEEKLIAVRAQVCVMMDNVLFHFYHGSDQFQAFHEERMKNYEPKPIEIYN